MMDIRIGDLRQRLSLESVARVADGGGGASENWVEVDKVWALLRPLSGQERVEADALSGRVSHEVWMRHRSDVEPEMRFSLGARVFDIRAVFDEEERHRFTKCLVEERDL